MNRKCVVFLAFVAMVFCGIFCNQNVHAEDLVRGAGVFGDRHYYWPPNTGGQGYLAYFTNEDPGHAFMYVHRGQYGLILDSVEYNYRCGPRGCETYHVWLDFGSDCNGTCEIVHPYNNPPHDPFHYGYGYIQGNGGAANRGAGIGECGDKHDQGVTSPGPMAFGGIRALPSTDQTWQYYQVMLYSGNPGTQDVVVVFRKKKEIPAEFEGQVHVSGGKASTQTGFVRNSKTVSIAVECDKDKGCTDVTFTHDLRRKGGTGSDNSGDFWQINRETLNVPSSVSQGIIHESYCWAGGVETVPNSWGAPCAGLSFNQRKNVFKPYPSPANPYNPRWELRQQTYPSTTAGRNTSKNINTEEGLPALYPGERVCEFLLFGLNGEDRSHAIAKACIFAKDLVPHEFKGEAGLHLGVRNNSLNENDFVKQVYAKPGDSVTFKADYQSDAQQFANDTSADKVQINGGGLIENNGNPLSSFLSPWNNAFNVKRFLGVSGQRRVSWNKDYKYDTGDSSGHMELNSYDEIGLEDAGTSIDERASTDDNGNVRTTPKEVNTWTEKIPVEMENDGQKWTEYIYNLVANINTEEMADEAYVRVPYNFKNDTRVTTEDDIVFAGESKTINYDYIINPRENQYTTSNYPSEKYATIVRNPKWKVQLCENNGCSTGSWMDTTVQSASQYIPDLHNGRTIAQKTTLSIRDLPAGSTVCVRSGVYPATSGDPRNYSNANGDGQWAYSAPKCFTVAKKPSLQVWGGNIYSLSGINTHVSKKTNLSGVSGYSYDINRESARRAFGSWGEQGVIVANGGTTGFSSGASMGYNDNGNALNVGGGGTATGLGGSSKIELCSRVPESFSNISSGVNCLGDGPIQGIGIDTVASTIDSQKNDVIGRLVGDTGGNNWSNDINGGTPIERKVLEGNVQTNISYSYASGGDHVVGDGAIRELTLDGEKTRVFAVRNGSITINSNIKYADASHTSLEGSPKVVIVAIGNNSSIRISCNVTRIDGLLVTDGKVDTCYDMSDNERNALERVTESKNGSLFNDNTRKTFNAIVAKSSNPLKINGAVIADKLEAKRTYGAATGLNSIVPGEIINFDPTLYLWGKIITPQTSEGGNNDDKKDLEEGELTITTQHEIAPRL